MEDICGMVVPGAYIWCLMCYHVILYSAVSHYCCCESLDNPHEGSGGNLPGERPELCVCQCIGRRGKAWNNGRAFPAHLHDPRNIDQRS